MKYFFGIVFLLCTQCSWSQTASFSYQLQKIIDDAPNDFKNLRRTIKHIRTTKDTVYFTKIGVEGSLRNEIEQSYPNDYWVFTSILDSSGTKKAKKNIQPWKKNLQAALDDSYKMKTIDYNFGKTLGGARGYEFTGNKIQVLLYYTYLSNADISHIYLTVKRAPVKE